jgi:hypothetical protein
MRSFIETGVIITACGSAAFWFLSAMCRLPHIKQGMDEPDKLTEPSRSTGPLVKEEETNG